MNTDTLVRKMWTGPDPTQHISHEVMEYASSRLGYHHPKREHLAREGDLAKALRIAGIIPFEPKSVSKYKKEKTHVVNNETWLKNAGKIGLSSFVVALVFLFFCVSFQGPLKLASQVVLGISGLLTIMAMITAIVRDREFGRWHLIPVKDYTGPIPAFALVTAKEIHQRVPKAEFFIDEFAVAQVPKDPFLVVKHGVEEYYIEVWEEPGYEQKRKA